MKGGSMSERKLGSVTYREVGEDYFDKRGLRRHAGVTSLWALGVGAVISASTTDGTSASEPVDSGACWSPA